MVFIEHMFGVVARVVLGTQHSEPVLELIYVHIDSLYVCSRDKHRDKSNVLKGKVLLK